MADGALIFTGVGPFGLLFALASCGSTGCNLTFIVLFGGSFVSMASEMTLVSSGFRVSGHDFCQSILGNAGIRESIDDGAIEVMETSTAASTSLPVVLTAFNSKAGSSPALNVWGSKAVSVNSAPLETSLGWAIVCGAMSLPASSGLGRKTATVSVAVASATELMIAKFFFFIFELIRMLFVIIHFI